MILEFDKYIVTTDERNFILNKKKVIQKSKYPEKIGTIEPEPFQYFSTPEGVLRALGKQMVLDYNDLNVIVDKLNELEAFINKFADTLKVMKEEV